MHHRGRRGGFPVVLLVVLALAGHRRLAAQGEPDSAIGSGREAATQWLARLARADYDGSWDQASSYFRSRVARDDWRGAAARLVIPRGAPRILVESRWDHGTAADSGEHLLLRWTTALGDGHELGERVVLLRDADLQWRVAVYEQFPAVNGDLIAPEGRRPVVPPPPAPRPTTIAAPRKP